MRLCHDAWHRALVARTTFWFERSELHDVLGKAKQPLQRFVSEIFEMSKHQAALALDADDHLN